MTKNHPLDFPKSHYLESWVIDYVTSRQNVSKKLRILDFKKGRELTFVGGKHLTEIGRFDHELPGELKYLVER